MADTPHPTYSADIAIIGGGIAGLWLLNRLASRGYNAVVLEKTALGSHQTVASQGMIHGGIKYTLGGALTGASEAIAEMPDHWRACLRGEGDVDLRGARVLSEHFYLWSSAGLGSRMGTFFASKATRGRVDRVKSADLPAVLRDPAFRGSVYKLVDMVVDTPSLIRALAANYPERLFRMDWQGANWQRDDDGGVALTLTGEDGRPFDLQAGAFVFAAGEGNEALLREVGCPAPAMQRRPLQQAMVRHRSEHRFYGHCLGTEATPRLTISSHPLADGSQVWYLGGTLAEKGVDMSADQLIAAARRELADLLPWLDLGSDAEWAALPVTRAEPRQRNFARPDEAFAKWAAGVDNVIAAWPTKLTLTPNLADRVEKLLRERRLEPSLAPAPALPLARPEPAATPWAKAFGVADAPA
jgi:glycerol-3-phosphate dehydrogenase